jgi:flagellar hook-basal body complex protein FliE
MKTTPYSAPTVDHWPSAAKRPEPEMQSADSFGGVLQSAVGEVERLQQAAEHSVQNFSTGGHQDLHGTMIALEKADVAFQLLTHVRNKVIEAYETIMRMQV